MQTDKLNRINGTHTDASLFAEALLELAEANARLFTGADCNACDMPRAVAQVILRYDDAPAVRAVLCGDCLAQAEADAARYTAPDGAGDTSPASVLENVSQARQTQTAPILEALSVCESCGRFEDTMRAPNGWRLCADCFRLNDTKGAFDVDARGSAPREEIESFEESGAVDNADASHVSNCPCAECVYFAELQAAHIEATRETAPEVEAAPAYISAIVATPAETPCDVCGAEAVSRKRHAGAVWQVCGAASCWREVTGAD
jgi:hypothetical protein